MAGLREDLTRRLKSVRELTGSLTMGHIYWQSLEFCFQMARHLSSYSFIIHIYRSFNSIKIIFHDKIEDFHGFHTYGGKIAGYIQGTFFIVLFFSGFYLWFYYIMIISGIIAFSENILITLFLEESRAEVKGLYWVFKTRKEMEKS